MLALVHGHGRVLACNKDVVGAMHGACSASREKGTNAGLCACNYSGLGQAMVQAWDRSGAGWPGAACCCAGLVLGLCWPGARPVLAWCWA